MNKYLKYALIAGGILLTGYLCQKAYASIKANLEAAAAQRKIDEAQRQLRIEKFEKSKNRFKNESTDAKITQITLMNNNIKSTADKSYLYDKLSKYKQDALSCTYEEEVEFKAYTEEFVSLSDFLSSDADEEAINAKILSLQKEDYKIQSVQDRINAEAAEIRKHQRELDILNQKHKAELETYEAKAEIEKAKLKTICAAMGGNDSNKNVSTQLNIKADLKED